MDVATLPFIDEHFVHVAAPADTVWRHIGVALGRSGAASRVAGLLLAVVPRRASGDPLVEGATLPGFSVRDAVPGDRLVLAGRHRFSEYALILTLVDTPGGTRLSAATHAHFPGVRGRLYRALVISSGAHRVLLVRMLRGIRRSAEADAA
jgi:hypothetical protein